MWPGRALRGLAISFPGSLRLLCRWQTVLVLLLDPAVVVLWMMAVFSREWGSGIPWPGPVWNALPPIFSALLPVVVGAVAFTVTTEVLAVVAAGGRGLGLRFLLLDVKETSLVVVVVFLGTMATGGLSFLHPLDPFWRSLLNVAGQFAYAFSRAWATWRLFGMVRGPELAAPGREDILVGAVVVYAVSLLGGIMFWKSGVSLPTLENEESIVLFFAASYCVSSAFSVFGRLWFLQILVVSADATAARTGPAPSTTEPR